MIRSLWMRGAFYVSGKSRRRASSAMQVCACVCERVREGVRIGMEMVQLALRHAENAWRVKRMTENELWNLSVHFLCLSSCFHSLCSYGETSGKEKRAYCSLCLSIHFRNIALARSRSLSFSCALFLLAFCLSPPFVTNCFFLCAVASAALPRPLLLLLRLLLFFVVNCTRAVRRFCFCLCTFSVEFVN